MSQAFVYDVAKNSEDSHQTSPAWMLTFVRWANRDPNNHTNPQAAGGDLAVTDPLVVINDCVSVSVNVSKSSHTPSMSAILRAGDINYLTSIAPGDFVFVNMADWEKDIDDVYERAKASKPINQFKDGFKGYFKVQSVRRILTVNPASGSKEVMFQVEGFGFTEFNNMIYFNPHLIPPGSDNNQALFLTNLSRYWHSLFSTNGLPTVQEVIRFFIKSFLGEGQLAAGINRTVRQSGANADFTSNTQFYVPQGVGSLLGQDKAKAAKDLYIYLMGIQQYSSGNTNTPELSLLPSNLNPVPKDGRFFYTKQTCQGRAFVKPDYWNQVPVWSVMEQYLNSPINEMYVSYRPAPNGLVMPTFTMRQMPFSSEKYKGVGTKFLNLPRWRIDPGLIYDVNIGRDEAARINFVQVFGMMTGSARPDLSIAYPIAKGNYVSDNKDIKRSGLRPYVITSNFDLPALQSQTSNKQYTRALEWKNLLGDALIGGHLKLNGTITTVGIVDPISPGDNLELGDTVYHIESVSHSATLAPGGQKTFRTTLELSHGISKFSNTEKKVYSQMVNSKMEIESREDYNNGDGMLPGIVDSETVYPDPFFDMDAASKNKSFDLPPKSFGKPKKQGKLKKRSKKVAK
jgi:hypothetical protein